jgi:hypothetical protein
MMLFFLWTSMQDIHSQLIYFGIFINWGKTVYNMLKLIKFQNEFLGTNLVCKNYIFQLTEQI